MKWFYILFVCSLAFAETQSQINTRSHADRFRVTTAPEMAAQYDRLASALRAVKALLAKEQTSADLFGEFQLAAVETELAQRRWDLPALEQTLRALLTNRPPLELPAFETLRREIRGFIGRARSNDPESVPRYRQAIEVLAQNDPVTQPTFEQELEVRNALETLIALGQAPLLVDHWRRRRTVPNAFLRISDRAIQKLVPPIPIHQTQTIHTTQQGVTLRGSGVGNGSGVVRLVPNPSTAKLEARIRADIHATAVGTMPVGRHTAQVGIQSDSHVEGSLPVELSSEWKPQVGSLSLGVRTQTQNLWSSFSAALPLVRRLGGRIVMNQANKKLPQANAQTQAQIEGEIRPKYAQLMHDKVNPKLQSLNTMIDNAVRFPLLRTGRLPPFHASTDAAAMQASIWFADPTQVAAFTPPSAPNEGDIDIKIHESVVNNGAALLSGGSLDEDLARETLLAGLFEQPEEDKVTGVTLTTLHFADAEPLRMRIDPEGISIRFSLSGFSLGARRFDYPGTLTAHYQTVMADEALFLVRQGDVEIAMPGYAEDKRAAKLLPGMADRVLVPRARLKLPTLSFELEGKPIKVSFRVKKIWNEVRGWLSIQLEANNE